MNEQEKFIKNAQETVGSLTDSLKMFSSVETVFKDQLDLANPISRKDVTVDGKNIFVSITKSNQVVFNFASADHAQEFYERTDYDAPNPAFETYMLKCRELGELRATITLYFAEPWYKRIFKKKPCQ